MRSLARFFALALVSTLGLSSAQAASTATVVYTGQNQENITLNSVLYRTEYQDRPVTRMCQRQEFAGYVWRCNGAPAPGPRPVPGHQCVQVPVYRYVNYPCTIIERVPVQVFDANVMANVTLNFAEFPQGLLPNEAFTVSLDGMELKLMARSTGKAIISKREAITASRQGSLVSVAANYGLSFRDAAPVLAAYKNGIQKMSVVNGKISFQMNTAAEALGMPYHLRVVRERALGSDTLVFNRPVPFNTFRGTPSNSDLSLFESTYAEIGLPALGSGKFSFLLTSKFEVAGETILNAADLGGPIEASRSVLLTIR